MGGKPKTSTSADQRLKANNPNAGKSKPSATKPTAKSTTWSSQRPLSK